MGNTSLQPSPEPMINWHYLQVFPLPSLIKLSVDLKHTVVCSASLFSGAAQIPAHCTSPLYKSFKVISKCSAITSSVALKILLILLVESIPKWKTVGPKPTHVPFLIVQCRPTAQPYSGTFPLPPTASAAASLPLSFNSWLLCTVSPDTTLARSLCYQAVLFFGKLMCEKVISVYSNVHFSYHEWRIFLKIWAISLLSVNSSFCPLFSSFCHFLIAL